MNEAYLVLTVRRPEALMAGVVTEVARIVEVKVFLRIVVFFPFFLTIFFLFGVIVARMETAPLP